MTQNTSSAVMAQRIEPHDSLDDFPTPPWGTRALMTHVLQPPRHWRIWEPACNRGFMCDALREYCDTVIASDIYDYGIYAEVRDFLWPTQSYDVDWVITNPPFRLAAQFIEKGLSVANQGVAMLVRTQFLESVGRYENLFKDQPPSTIAVFTERLTMVKGRLDPECSTATSYCWVIWQKSLLGQVLTRFMWIPPCRKQLEKPGDYA